MLLSKMLSLHGFPVEDMNKFLEVLMVGTKIPDLGVALLLENMPIASFLHKSVVLTSWVETHTDELFLSNMYIDGLNI